MTGLVFFMLVVITFICTSLDMLNENKIKKVTVDDIKGGLCILIGFLIIFNIFIYVDVWKILYKWPASERTPLKFLTWLETYTNPITTLILYTLFHVLVLIKSKRWTFAQMQNYFLILFLLISLTIGSYYGAYYVVEAVWIVENPDAGLLADVMETTKQERDAKAREFAKEAFRTIRQERKLSREYKLLRASKDSW